MAESKTDTNSDDHASGHDNSIKETVVTLLISFALALVFRSYVIEAFRIPTGSMAPTLLGANMAVRGDETGYNWRVNPWQIDRAGTPARIQRGIAVTDPMTTNDPAKAIKRGPRDAGDQIAAGNIRTSPGDRILVLKYLYSLFEPTRYDVVVFKNPTNPQENYIKRLVGLPGEQVYIAAGDIFTKRDGEAWGIRRKPVHVLGSLWRPLYSSEYRPLSALSYRGDAKFTFEEPWLLEGADLHEHVAYRTTGEGASRLVWNHDDWPVTDWEPFNETEHWVKYERFPTPDVRLHAGVKPDADGLRVAARIVTLGHEFRAEIDGDQAVVTRRPLDATDPDRRVAATIRPLPAGEVTDIAFSHADQTMRLWIEGELVIEEAYDDWAPDERVRLATGLDESQYMEAPGLLMNASRYGGADTQASWRFEGPAATIYRVGLDRDIYHRPFAQQRKLDDGRTITFLGHATHPASIISLNEDQYFVLGDNSPASLDGRGWTGVDQDVAVQIDDTVGVVPRKLMIGKAFYVYFPPLHRNMRIPVPDTGDMRVIH